MVIKSFALCIFISTCFAVHASEHSLKIAVASSFAPIAKEISKSFEQQHNLKINWISAASGTLYQQILHGAPFDAFFSADKDRPVLLAEKGKIIATSVQPYAVGQLSLYSAKYPNISVDSISQDIKASKQTYRRIAIANPTIAPYGKAAKAWLEHMDFWQRTQFTTITGINVGQTFQQIRSKAADFGIVSTSQLIANNLPPHIVTLPDPTMLAQYAGVISTSDNKQLANALINYFRSDDIQQKLAKQGYLHYAAITKDGQ